MSNLKEKYGPWAVVTGGTSGIGEELVNKLSKAGINVALAARREDMLQAKSKEIEETHGVKTKIIVADLSKPDGYQKVIQETNDIEVGLFIPSAAKENHGFATDIDLHQELALIQLNITSVFALTQHFSKRMVSRGKGGVMLVASIIGQMPNPYMANYSASKAYVINLGTSLHWELKKKGVDVTVLSPGPTDTPMLKNGDFDVTKMPLSVQTPEYVANVGLTGLLAKKPIVIPGTKNGMMVFMSKLMPISTAISSGGKMMEKAMPSLIQKD